MPSDWVANAEMIAQCGALAALLEVSGYPKPGNIHRTQDFHETRYEHFLASSIAIMPTLREIAHRGHVNQLHHRAKHELGIGAAILQAVKATQYWQSGGNTNLGIILLFIPLACAVGTLLTSQNPSITQLQASLDQIIKSSTPLDASQLYEAIQLANPGGLGTVDTYDLTQTSPAEIQAQGLNLFDIFQLSASWDSIAREWITQFQITLEIGYPYFLKVFQESNDINISTVHTYLHILGTIPDTLIIRKHGITVAENLSTKAKLILEQGGLLSQQSVKLLWNFDSELRIKKKLNPGTSADLTAASIMIALISGLRI